MSIVLENSVVMASRKRAKAKLKLRNRRRLTFGQAAANLYGMARDFFAWVIP